MAITPEMMRQLAEEAQAAKAQRLASGHSGAKLEAEAPDDHGMTEEAIAAELGISKQRVSYLIHRALAKLKPLFEAAGYRDGRRR